MQYYVVMFVIASHVSQFPSLNFLVYVPKQSESPLFIRSSSDSEDVSLTDNFLVPQWGGMIIHNSQELSGSEAESGSDGVLHLRVRMEKLMPIFVEQLKMLLGVPNMVMAHVHTQCVVICIFWQPAFQDGVGGAPGRFQHSAGKHGIVDWVSVTRI